MSAHDERAFVSRQMVGELVARIEHLELLVVALVERQPECTQLSNDLRYTGHYQEWTKNDSLMTRISRWADDERFKDPFEETVKNHPLQLNTKPDTGDNA